MLHDKTRLLVTNSVGFLNQVDRIVVVKDGRITEQGTYKELLKKGGEFTDYLLEHVQANVGRRGSAGGFGDSESELEELKAELETALGRKAPLERGRLGRQLSDAAEGSHASSGGTRSRASLQGSVAVAAPAGGKPPFGRGSRGRGGGSRGGQGGGRRGGGSGPSPVGQGEGLMVKEKVETTEVKWSIYLFYAKAVGGLTTSLIFAFALLTQVRSLKGPNRPVSLHKE